MNKNYILLLALAFLGCAEENHEVNKLSEVNELTIQKEYLDGIDIEYYPSGKIRRETEMRDGFMNGMDYKYYENGVLKYKGLYKDGQLDGWEYYYHENGELYVKTDYLMVPKKGQFNQRIVYDSLGKMIDSLTDCFVITYVDDTITDMESLKFDIELHTDWNSHLRIFYNLDSDFNILSEDVLPMTETGRVEYASIRTSFLKGKNKLPIIVEHSSDVSKKTINAKRIYGYLEFYVQ